MKSHLFAVISKAVGGLNCKHMFCKCNAIKEKAAILLVLTFGQEFFLGSRLISILTWARICVEFVTQLSCVIRRCVKYPEFGT